MRRTHEASRDTPYAMKIDYRYYRKLLAAYSEILQNELGDSLVSLILYGSVARGEAKKESDIDLLIVVRGEKRSYYEMLSPIMKAENKLKSNPVYKEFSDGSYPYFSYLVLSQDEASESHNIYLDILADGIVLHDPARFFSERLKHFKMRVKELGSKKVTLPDGRWYWDLKPDLVPGEVFEL